MNFNGISQKFLKKGTFFKGSIILGLTTVLSYALGLLRDRVFAQTFGASSALDAYNAAFSLPDLILNIFVAGALTAAFVPIFSDLISEQKNDEANDFISSVINGSLLVVLLSGLFVFIFAPQLSRLIVPGFNSATRQLFINVTRLLLLSPIIFSISNTLGNIIVTKEKFFWFGISAALYNLGTILGAVFLSAKFGIYGVAFGTIFGALLHLFSRIIGLTLIHKRAGEKGHFKRYRIKIHLNEYYRRFIRMMLPKVIGQPVEQITFLGFTIIASTIGAGSIAILNFAHNFQSMPINVIGVTFAMTIFPVISRLAAQKDRSNFWLETNFTLKSILLFTIPAALFIILVRHYLIAIFLGGGAFDKKAIQLTGTTLGLFALSIPTESLTQLFARGFYALKNSITPVLTSLTGLTLAIISGYFLSRSLGIQGLAIGFFFGSITKTLILFVLLKREAGKLQNI